MDGYPWLYFFGAMRMNGCSVSENSAVSVQVRNKYVHATRIITATCILPIQQRDEM